MIIRENRKNTDTTLNKRSDKGSTHILYHVDNTDDGIPGPEEAGRAAGAARRRPRRVPARTAAVENSIIRFVFSGNLDGVASKAAKRADISLVGVWNISSIKNFESTKVTYFSLKVPY